MPAWRPRKYKTEKELKQCIDAYFKECDDEIYEIVTTATGERIEKKGVPYTIEGLSHSLWIDRQTLINYSKEEEFFGTIKETKEKILRHLQERATMGKYVPSITIFNLKNNYHYKDERNYNSNDNGGFLDKFLNRKKWNSTQ